MDNDIDTSRTFNGRPVFPSKFKLIEFEEFIQSISNIDEWKQWKILVEGDLVTHKEQFESALKALKPDSIFLVDKANKIMSYMNKDTYTASLDE